MINEAPLAEIICNKDATGRVAKWAINLTAHGVDYDRRTSIKSQVLADFLVDWTEMEHILSPLDTGLHWLMHFDGSKRYWGLGAGVVLTAPKGCRLEYVLQIHFTASNNVAEYEALAHGLKLAKAMGIKRILCYGDSDLVVQQITAHWDAKDANMAAYRFFIQQLAGYFDGCEFPHIHRTKNEAADTLANIGSIR